MRQYRVIDINDIKTEEYASFGIALMVMRMHNWECRSIIDRKLKMTRLVDDKDTENGSDDYYNFGDSLN